MAEELWRATDVGSVLTHPRREYVCLWNTGRPGWKAELEEMVGCHNSNLKPPEEIKNNLRYFKVSRQCFHDVRQLTPEFFRYVLHVPEDAVIGGLSPHYAFTQNCLVLRLYHASFPAVAEGTAVDVEEVQPCNGF